MGFACAGNAPVNWLRRFRIGGVKMKDDFKGVEIDQFKDEDVIKGFEEI